VPLTPSPGLDPGLFCVLGALLVRRIRSLEIQMSHRSGPEILLDYQQKLGSQLGEVHYHCQNEWVQAHVTWKQYKSLFSMGQERVDLLNKCGSAFFHRVQWYFGEATLLAICRLTDPLDPT